LIQEQFGHEKAARERHHEHIQDLLAREKEVREKHHESHWDFMEREKSSREATQKELLDMFTKDKALHEQHHAQYQDSMQREKSSRQMMEDLFAQEKTERSKHNETLNERVDSLQRTVNIFDSLVRKEMDEKSKEHKRLWDAIDNHTHDLSTQVLVDGVEKRPAIRDVQEDRSPVRTGSVTPTAIRSAWPASSTRTTTLETECLAPFITIPAAPPAVRTVQPVKQVRVSSPSVASRGAFRGLASSSQMIPTTVVSLPAQSTTPPGSGALTPQMVSRSPTSPMITQKVVSQQNSRSNLHEHHTVEKITCGHTRYGGEKHTAAEVPLD